MATELGIYGDSGMIFIQFFYNIVNRDAAIILYNL